MNQNSDKTDKRLEKVVGAMEPGRQLSDEELENILTDDAAMDDYRLLLNCRQAAMRRAAPVVPDVSKSWKQFRRKMRPAGKNVPLRTRYLAVGAFVGIAASFLVVFLYTWLSGFPVKNNVLRTVLHYRDTVQQIVHPSPVPTAKTSAHPLHLGIAITALPADTMPAVAVAEPVQTPAKSADVKMNTYSTSKGRELKVTLADGTVVWLGSGTRLEYPSYFSGDERRVYLRGEAYFKVTKDPSHPFVIQTGRMQAKVLGTELHVRYYSPTDSHVALITGRVEVSDNAAHTVHLKPGEEADWNGAGAMRVRSIDVDTYTYWRDGYFYFDDAPLADIMRELGRWYFVNIVFEKKSLMNLKMRYFCLRNQPLDRAISLLNRMGEVKARVEGDTVYLR